MAEKDKLADGKDRFHRALEAWEENAERFEEDVRFARMGEQWPAEIRLEREQSARPCLTINRMPAFIRQVVNDARQNKPAIKVKPVDSNADPETADVINGLIRNIEVTSNADVAYDTAVENAVTGGFGYWRVETDYAYDDVFDLDLKITRIANPLTVVPDPASIEADSCDWNEAFISDLYTKAEFEARWKGADKVDFETDDEYRNDWIEDEMVRVAEWWQRERVKKTILKLSSGEVLDGEHYEKHKELFDSLGLQVVGEREGEGYKVRQRIMSGAQILEENDWAGRYIPIIPVYGDEVVLDGRRHFFGLIHHAKDAQRQYNYWRTTSTELAALSPRVPFIGPVGAFDTDGARWATANTHNHAYLEYDGPIAPQRQPFSGVPAGALQEAMNASDDMKSVMGLYDASLGQRSNETSGRAILARQREGDTSTFHFIDNLNRAIRHTGKVIIDLLPHVYNAERIVRILGEDGTENKVQVNAPYEVQQPNGVVQKLHDLTVGKYDVVCDTGPSFNTRREESATQMLELLRVFPQAAPMLGDLLAKNMDWPGADEIAERMKAMLPPQLQGQDPRLQQMQQVMQQMQQAMGQLQQENQQLKMRQQFDAQKAQTDARKVDIEGFKAETDRMEAMRESMTPEQVQSLVLQTIQQLMTPQGVQ